MYICMGPTKSLQLVVVRVQPSKIINISSIPQAHLTCSEVEQFHD